MNKPEDRWSEVDRYVASQLIPPDPQLDATLRASDTAGLPSISVSPPQGRLLYVLALLCQAHAILEVGTLGGYSTIWLARALPVEGRLITLEADPKHAEVARTNILRAGLDGVVDIRLGRAQDTLPALVHQAEGPFDLIFIDADKPSYPEYFAWALKLSRKGTLIIADNVVRNGSVIEAASSDPMVVGVRSFIEMMATEPRVSATVIQTVGAKGYDGFAIGLVTSD